MKTTQSTSPTTTEEVKLGGWWALPEEEQKQILAALPLLDEWSFTATRVSDAAWSIDVPEAGTYGELLVGGTNFALDEHFLELNQEEAINGAQVTLTVSIKPMDDLTTTFIKQADDKMWEGSATYTDMVLGINCWLCPFTTVLWQHTPQVIYIRIS